MLDTAFEALKKFDWGSDLGALSPIEDAVVSAHGKPDMAKEIESRLAAALQMELSRDAREYVCRKLAVVGTAASVPAIAPLLIDKDSSHMARFALEQIPAAEAAAALRDAIPKAAGPVKVGLASSLGARRDTAAVGVLSSLLKDADVAVAQAATLALGAIGTAEAVAALQDALKAPGKNGARLVDALFSCAESLLAGNQSAAATAIYRTFADENQPRLVRLAATRGLLACASKTA